MDHFEGKEWKFKFLKTYIRLQYEGNNHRCPTRGAENGLLGCRQRVARLKTFMLTLLIVSWLYHSARLFTHCTIELVELGFFLLKPDFIP